MRSSPEATELIVALDVPKADQALQLVRELKALPVLYKVGLELFISAGPDFVKTLTHEGHRVFLYLKLHDIPNTVAMAAKQAAFLRVEMLTIHTASGPLAFRAIREAFAEIPDFRPKILGVTVLTSFDDMHWADVTRAMTGHAVSTAFSVHGSADALVQWGADGVVCSAYELEWLGKNHPALKSIVPGIRPLNPDGTANRDDQARVMTPAQARELGAHAIVVGRPVTQAKNPRQATEAILRELGVAV